MDLEIGKVGQCDASFVYVVIYKALPENLNMELITKMGTLKKAVLQSYILLLLNDERPPKIVAKKRIAREIVLTD